MIYLYISIKIHLCDCVKKIGDKRNSRVSPKIFFGYTNLRRNIHLLIKRLCFQKAFVLVSLKLHWNYMTKTIESHSLILTILMHKFTCFT